MAVAVIEVSTLFFKGVVNFNDSSNPAFCICQDMLSKISQREGYQRAYYGQVLEDPAKVQILIGEFSASSVDSHLALIRSFVS